MGKVTHADDVTNEVKGVRLLRLYTFSLHGPTYDTFSLHGPTYDTAECMARGVCGLVVHIWRQA